MFDTHIVILFYQPGFCVHC